MSQRDPLQLLTHNTTRLIRSVYLRVPGVDFPLIPAPKTEVRMQVKAKGPTARLKTPWPLPIWVWRKTAANTPDGKLVVCEAVWQEPIMAMTPESLAAEGFATMDDFKRYWRLRTGKLVSPTEIVTVYRLSPFDPATGYTDWGFRCLDLLYGPVSG